MPSTTKGFPYPANSDNVDVPGDMQALAEAIDLEFDDYLTEASASATYAPLGAGGSKNLLYNGAMQVSQRGTSTASITTSGYYTADRWNVTNSSLATWTQTVEADAPTGSGLRRSIKMLCTTADSTPSAADVLRLDQYLEGQDLQRIAKGTASAQKLTLSFWVKANVTGTYILELIDADNSRNVSASYSVSASATWEKKVITFPADTTGAFDNDNAVSLRVAFWLGAGSDFTSGTLATTWGTPTTANRAAGQTNVAAATNNYWQITGVQLEIGDTAGDFEFKSYGQELAECQRYYYLHASGSGAGIGSGGYVDNTAVETFFTFPVTMRATPNLVATSGTNYYRLYRAGNDDFNSFTIGGSISLRVGDIFNNSEVSGTAGNFGIILTNNAASSVAFNAEL